MAQPVSTIEYQGRTFTVVPTNVPAAPFALVGKRGAALTLVPHRAGRGLFFVRTASGKLNGGFVGQLADGTLIHLPASGPLAYDAQTRWRTERTSR